MQQNTPDWLAFRRTGIGSSDVAAIMGKCPFRTRYQVYLSKVEGLQQEDNFAMARGREWEPVLRAKAEEKYNCRFEPRVAKVTLDGVLFIASLDGDNGDMLLEGKVPGKENIALAESGKLPEHYMLQVQQQLLVSGRPKALYACFDFEKKENVYVEVLPDYEIQSELQSECVKFWREHIEPKLPPELAEGDYIECSEDVYALEASHYKYAKQQFDLAEAALESAKDALKERLGKLPGLRGHGLKLWRYSRKGNVQTSRIPELIGVDLEKYRAKPVSVFKITEEKDG